jgi:hypothetical protein
MTWVDRYVTGEGKIESVVHVIGRDVDHDADLAAVKEQLREECEREEARSAARPV